MTSFVSIYSLYKRALLPESWKLQFPVRSLKLSNLGHGLHLDGGPVKCWSWCCSQKYRKNLRSGETGPQKHTYSWDHAPPPKKTKFLINYSSYRDTGRIFFLKYNQIKNVFLLTVQYDHKNMFFSSWTRSVRFLEYDKLIKDRSD